MKICPKCKASLDDNARFCLHCMTSLEEKELIPTTKAKARRWPLVLLCFLLLGALLFFAFFKGDQPQKRSTPTEAPKVSEPPDLNQPSETSESPESTETIQVSDDPSTITCSVDGVIYSFRPATAADHPTAITLDNHFVLIRVEGSPSDGVYRVPSFVGDDTNALVTVIADGAFHGTDAKVIDLGHNVRYVWGNSFGGYSLTELHLHEDVFIDQAAFSGCTENLTIHCPDYLENTEGLLWSDLAVDYGFRWQNEVY